MDDVGLVVMDKFDSCGGQGAVQLNLAQDFVNRSLSENFQVGSIKIRKVIRLNRTDFQIFTSMSLEERNSYVRGITTSMGRWIQVPRTHPCTSDLPR